LKSLSPLGDVGLTLSVWRELRLRSVQTWDQIRR
jgi:hypothetical protein